MSRSRHCDCCGDWHDLEKPWPHNCISHYGKRQGEDRIGLQIIKDIDPYKAVGLPGQPIIGGRRQHKDAMRAHGMVEVGNEKVTQTYEAPPGLREDLKRAIYDTHGDL